MIAVDTKGEGNVVNEKKVVGRKYVMLEGKAFRQGTILELVKDDGTFSPRFKDVNTGVEAFVCMHRVALIDKNSERAVNETFTIELTAKEVRYITGIMGESPVCDGFNYLYDQFLYLKKKDGK